MSLDFDALFEGVDGGMSKEEAVYSLLAIAMHIDGEVDSREAAEFDTLISQSKLLKGADKAVPGKVNVDLRNKVLSWLGEPSKYESTIKNACASLRHEGTELCKSVFAQAVDIILADLRLHANEKAYIKLLTQELKLEDPFVEKTIRVLTAKNDF